MKKTTKPSFLAYVDESGDEGFVFRENGEGSSRWFVLSAAVIRQTNDLDMVSCLKIVQGVLKRPPKTSLHFVNLKHEQRKPYAKRVGELPIRTVSVLIHKPSIDEFEKFQSEKYRLYRYATRMLLERVSWLCREHRREGEGDGYTEVIFSNRSNMSYNDMRDYISRILKRGETDPSVQLDPSVIDPERIRTVEHSKLAGLQVADAVASSIHYAVKLNRYNEVETAYMEHLKKTFYRHKKEVLGYGLKFWPEDFETVKAKAPELKSIEGLLK